MRQMAGTHQHTPPAGWQQLPTTQQHLCAESRRRTLHAGESLDLPAAGRAVPAEHAAVGGCAAADSNWRWPAAS